MQTKPNREAYAATNARRQGFEVYYPRVFNPYTRTHGSLFPSYIFVRLAGSWAPLNGTYGVARVIMFGEQVAVIDNADVKRLRQLEDPHTKNIKLPDSSFVRGERLEVTQGHLKGFEGLFAEMDGPARVVMLFEILGKQVRTQIPRRAVKRTGT